jgi:hypothetical protein
VKRLERKTNRQGAKSARLWASDDTLDATLKYVDTEVDEEAQTKSSGFQVGEDLREVDRCEAFKRREAGAPQSRRR